MLIDDARYFLGPPPVPHEISGWPDWESVLRALRQLSSTHAVICSNDTILFVPAAVQGALRDFLHRTSVDLVTVADKARDYDTVLAQSKDKDREIAALYKETATKDREIEAKDREIAALVKETGSKDREIESKDRENDSLLPKARARTRRSPS